MSCIVADKSWLRTPTERGWRGEGGEGGEGGGGRGRLGNKGPQAPQSHIGDPQRGIQRQGYVEEKAHHMVYMS